MPATLQYHSVDNYCYALLPGLAQLCDLRLDGVIFECRFVWRIRERKENTYYFYHDRNTICFHLLHFPRSRNALNGCVILTSNKCSTFRASSLLHRHTALSNSKLQKELFSLLGSSKVTWDDSRNGKFTHRMSVDTIVPVPRVSRDSPSPTNHGRLD